MQRSDGAVWHAVTQADFYLEGLGHKDPYPRYLMPVSTTATADLAAVMAQAYRIYKDIDQDYADQCLSSAVKAWGALDDVSIWTNPNIDGAGGTPQYPEEHGYSVDPPGMNMTANYVDTDDSDEIYWAAIELYLTTGDAQYYDYVEDHLNTLIFYPSLWPAVAHMASFSYVMGVSDTSDPLRVALANAITVYADLYVQGQDTTGFGLAMSPGDYYWGSNNVVAQFAYTMILAHEITGEPAHRELAQDHLNYILGANSLNQTFISGVGDQPVIAIFHLPSFHDGIAEVVPGLIPGGPNQFLVPTDVVLAKLITSEDPPPAKCYIDSECSFASNETVILESASWAFVIGYFYNHQTECTVGNQENRWIGPNTGNWHDSPLNWSRSEIPSICHDVVIPDDKSVTVTSGLVASCRTLEIEDGGFFDVLTSGVLDVLLG